MTTNLYEMFGTDKRFEQEGIWYAFSEDTKFLLARAGGSNVRFAKVLEAKTRPYRRQIENESIDLDLANGLLIEAFAEAVLLGWQGVTDADGNDLPYSRENAVKLLKDLPDLFAELRNEATRLSNFRTEEIEEDAGN